VSISLSFYDQIFHTKVQQAAFLKLQLGFVIFWGQEIAAKAAHKILMKLNTNVNFIHQHFTCEFFILKCFKMLMKLAPDNTFLENIPKILFKSVFVILQFMLILLPISKVKEKNFKVCSYLKMRQRCFYPAFDLFSHQRQILCKAIYNIIY